eukprot:CAMPEP_0170516298 /NCGR_PEP_ID=MMETSP0209-20121228/2548_1 /TAXON_ID=665100 ORGANISM="Litonotus pictus, Strain P1" /NCGR_SAMPLE_ID=MMETSP0209 /ASSEMBLY_ACC=CAM_ASM_000301 /LENGTH=281 /DNA_ID=CAMNT_0010801119 /DNA_START=1 /DNA_END=843 /DNA_ORIENTATION=+
MDINLVTDWIFKNPLMYPGLHQESCARTSDAFKPLELKSQMLIIWRAFCEYLKEKANDCKGINIKGFGAFTYEVETGLPKIGIEFSKAKTKSFQELLVEKKTSYKLRPCFVVDPKIKKILTKFKDKDEISKPKSQSSIYQRGYQMTYCNPIPIAASCYLHKNVVSDTIDSIFTAVYDLITMGKNISLKFGFVNIYFFDKNLTYTFAPEVSKTMSNIHETQKKVRRGITPVSQNWKDSAVNKWERSSLSTLLERPHTPLIKTVDNKVQMLKIMSLDMASTNN